ncbi:MAG TPA: T9SS type A sorting domain-containing protein [bacterium]|nr:T9SS type A sorting domain-containing protein [bacterium]HXB98439.1 T9SS type A sorting domain-containing protein [bacterium]
MKSSLAPYVLAALLVAAGLRADTAASDGLWHPGFGPKGPSWHFGELLVAPNPVRQAGTVRYYLSSDGEAALSLIDMNGSLVRSWQLRGTPNSEAEFQIQLDGVASGTYLLVLYETRNGASAVVGTFKVAVRH